MGNETVKKVQERKELLDRTVGEFIEADKFPTIFDNVTIAYYMEKLEDINHKNYDSENSYLNEWHYAMVTRILKNLENEARKLCNQRKLYLEKGKEESEFIHNAYAKFFEMCFEKENLDYDVLFISNLFRSEYNRVNLSKSIEYAKRIIKSYYEDLEEGKIQNNTKNLVKNQLLIMNDTMEKFVSPGIDKFSKLGKELEEIGNQFKKDFFEEKGITPKK